MTIAFMAMRVLEKKHASFAWSVLLPSLVALGYAAGLLYKILG